MKVDVKFSPKGGCTDALAAVINGSKRSILLMCYEFNSLPLAAAIEAALHRGVKVRVVCDRVADDTVKDILRVIGKSGAAIRVDYTHRIMHDKVMIVDGSILTTGSFNFTSEAERDHAENLLIMRPGSALIKRYTDNFEAHWSHSTCLKS